ncbi:hypothetical protein, partial [Novipirellula maiorica]
MTTSDSAQINLTNHRSELVCSPTAAFKRCIGLLFTTIALLSLAAITAGMFGKWHFLLDLASHLRVQATIGILSSGFVLLLIRWRRVAGIFLLVGGVLLISLLPYFWPTEPVSGQTFRLMTANVLTRNTQHATVLQAVAETDPDFVVLQETDASWTGVLEDGL